MPQRLSMRKIRDVLRLKYELGRSHREIAAILRISHSTVGSYVRRAREAGVSWPLPDDLDATALEAAPYPPPDRVARALSISSPLTAILPLPPAQTLADPAARPGGATGIRERAAVALAGALGRALSRPGPPGVASAAAVADCVSPS